MCVFVFVCMCVCGKCSLERGKIDNLGREGGREEGRYIEVENRGIEDVSYYKKM
jgi:hypothetical protein